MTEERECATTCSLTWLPACTPCVPSLLRLHLLLLGTVRCGSDASPRCTCTKATGRMRGPRKPGKGASREGSCNLACLLPGASGVILEWGGVRPCVKRRGHHTPLQSCPHSLSLFGPGRRLAGLQPGEHAAPPEDFGQAPRSDKGVGDGDTSVTAASGRGGGGGRVAAGTEARAQRQLCGCSGAGWEASITRCPLGQPQAPHAAPLRAPCPGCRSPARSLRTTGLAASTQSRRPAPPCSRDLPAAQPKRAIGRARRRRQLPPPRSHGDPRQPMQWTLGPCGTPGASTAPALLHYKYFSKMRRSSLRAPRPPAASSQRP